MSIEPQQVGVIADGDSGFGPFREARAVSDQCICVLHEQDETSSGIIIPDTAKQGGIIWCTVLHAGPGHVSDKGCFIPNIAEVGKSYLCRKGTYHKVHMRDGRELYTVRGRDMLAEVET